MKGHSNTINLFRKMHFNICGYIQISIMGANQRRCNVQLSMHNAKCYGLDN